MLPLLALAICVSGVIPSSAATVNVTISNFRYCQGNQCLPIDFVYVRNPTGNGFIHQNALAATLIFRDVVHPGDTIVWTYKDSLCDAIAGCPGHAVCFENGTPEGDCGDRVTPARAGPVTVSWTVPANAGGLIRYFCNVNGHYNFGMTGALLVK
ncbi:MAG: hypothetical protein ACRDKG_04075 [Actinomycetota bacterium]